MSFVANAADRNQGRRGHFGIAPQTEPGTYVPPTNYLRETGGSGFLPDALDRMSQAFRGTSFEAPSEYAGSDYQGRSVTTEATIADAILLFRLMFGTPDAQGVITPQDQTQWSDFLPLPAFSAQWGVPGAGHVQITDAQLHELTLTVPEQRTDLVTAALAFHAVKGVRHPQGAPIGGFVPATPVIPAYSGGLGRLEHSCTIAGVAYVPDSTSTARLYNPVDPLPANGEYVSGFAPGEGPIGAEFQMSFAKPIEALLALGHTKAFVPLVWRLAKVGAGTPAAPDKLVEITASVQVSAREVPIGGGRVRTSSTFVARSQTPGVSPFSIKVLNK